MSERISIGGAFLPRAARQLGIGPCCIGLGCGCYAAEHGGGIDFVDVATARAFVFHALNLAIAGYFSRSFSKEATTGIPVPCRPHASALQDPQRGFFVPGTLSPTVFRSLRFPNARPEAPTFFFQGISTFSPLFRASRTCCPGAETKQSTIINMPTGNAKIASLHDVDAIPSIARNGERAGRQITAKPTRFTLIRSDSVNAQRGSAPWIVAERSLHGGRNLKFTLIGPLRSPASPRLRSSIRNSHPSYPKIAAKHVRIGLIWFDPHFAGESKTARIGAVPYRKECARD
jgi:hypothetical protein